MQVSADGKGPLVTSDGDTRVTALGRILRKTKLDELPQLWNVLKGDMSLVGPRPEVLKYVEAYTSEQRRILKLKPGITDLASLQFRNEELLLKNTDNVEEFYARHCIPRKLQLNLQYARRANLLTDTWIILQTVCPYGICLLTVYSLVLAAAFWISCGIVYDFAFPARLREDFTGTMFAFLAVQLGTLIWRKQCKGLLSYFSLPEMRQIATALGFACILLLLLRALVHQGWPPRNLILANTLVAFSALAGFRLVLRLWRENASADALFDRPPPVRVGIIGAGQAGSRLSRHLCTDRRTGRTVVAFFDDDPQKWQRRIHEIPVVGMPECLLDGWAKRVDEVILAIPGAAAVRLREIEQLLREAGLKTYRAPSMRKLSWEPEDPGREKGSE